MPKRARHSDVLHEAGAGGQVIPSMRERQVRLLDRDALASFIAPFCQPWRRLLIGVDGRDSEGKSTIARYLAYKLGMPAIETDTFLELGTGKYSLRLDDLKRVIHGRLALDRPVILEGLFLLRTAEQLGVAVDLLVYARKRPAHRSRLESALRTYRSRHKPLSIADFVYCWHDPD